MVLLFWQTRCVTIGHWILMVNISVYPYGAAVRIERVQNRTSVLCFGAGDEEFLFHHWFRAE